MLWGGKLTSICSKSTRTCSSETSCNDCAVGSSPYDAEEFLWAELGFSFSFLILMLVNLSSWERKKSISSDPFSFTQQSTHQIASNLLYVHGSSGLWPVQGSSDVKKRNQSSLYLIYYTDSVLSPSSKDKRNEVLRIGNSLQRENCSLAPLPFLSPLAAQNWKHLMCRVLSKMPFVSL